jgi:hypothetical protein
MQFVSKASGLTIVVEPIRITKDQAGNIIRTPGKRIQFKDGRYTAKSDEDIAFLNAYSKKHSDMVTPITELDDEVVDAVRDAVKSVVGRQHMNSEIENKILKSVSKKTKARRKPKSDANKPNSSN